MRGASSTGAPRTTYRVHCGIPGLERPDTTVEAFAPETAAVLGARAFGLGDVTSVAPHETPGLWHAYSGPRELALVAVRAERP